MLPNSAPVCRSASVTPSMDTILAVSANAFWSNDWMYCFSVEEPPSELPDESLDPNSSVALPLSSTSKTPEAPGNSAFANPPIPGPSASSMLSMAEALLKSSSKAFAESSGFMGSVPMARSSLNRLSALRRKYPNMMDAAYICAHCSLDMRTRVLEYAFWVCGPSMPMRCSLTISNASTEWTPEVSLVRSTPRSRTSSSSSGGSMSTPMVRNFWRMLAYITSWTPLLRSSAFICSMRLKSTMAPLSFSSWLWLTSMEPSAASAWSSSSIMRSSVASTAASKSCGSASRTCASICPWPEPGDMGAPWNVGASPESDDAESSLADPFARVTVVAALRRVRLSTPWFWRPERDAVTACLAYIAVMLTPRARHSGRASATEATR